VVLVVVDDFLAELVVLVTVLVVVEAGVVIGVLVVVDDGDDTVLVLSVEAAALFALFGVFGVVVEALDVLATGLLGLGLWFKDKPNTPVALISPTDINATSTTAR
jgi:hypothetical protein